MTSVDHTVNANVHNWGEFYHTANARNSPTPETPLFFPQSSLTAPP